MPCAARGLLIAALLLGSALAWAQSNSREQEQIRRLRQQVQQLQQQVQQQATTQQRVQQLEAEAGTLKQVLADVRAASARASGRHTEQAQALQQQLEEARKAAQAQALSQQALRGQLDAANQSRATFAQSQTELRRQLQLRDADLAALTARHTSQAQGLQACIDSNQALHALGTELLQRYSTQTVAEVLQRDEPFLQFKRVALENLVQGYRDKLDLQALQPAASRTGVPLKGDGRVAP